ncbi:hypothetical protein T4B_13596, partial [Trichinella pseudospiralis]
LRRNFLQLHRVNVHLRNKFCYFFYSNSSLSNTSFRIAELLKFTQFFHIFSLLFQQFNGIFDVIKCADDTMLLLHKHTCFNCRIAICLIV